PHSAFLHIQLRSGFDGRTTPTSAYVEQLRSRLKAQFPSDDFFFETGGMIRRILNGGAVAPIEVQVHGRDMLSRRAVAHAPDRRPARAPQLRDVSQIDRTQGPVEVFHYQADRVSQLFVSIGDNDLGRVATEVDSIVGQLPLTYAVTVLPREKLLAHALKVFPKEQGDPQKDAELRRLLTAYFQDEEPDVAEQLRD